MKIRKSIQRLNNRYEVQVDVFGLTTQESEAIARAGYPVIEIGGDFSGSAKRASTNTTVATIVSDSGEGAVLTTSVTDGAVVGIDVTEMGDSYTEAEVSISGDGTGATATPLFGVVEVSIDDGGEDYAENDTIVVPGVAETDEDAVLTVTAVDVDGAVTTAVTTTPGEFEAVPTNPVTDTTTSGAGTGARFDLNWGISAVEVTSGGANYSVTPSTVEFTLPQAQRRLQLDFPVKRVFDIEDYSDADVMAEVWANTITARCTAARNRLLTQHLNFIGETIITV